MFALIQFDIEYTASLFITLAGFCIQAAICHFVVGIYKAIPSEHHKMKPRMVWLLLIPFFNIVWNFFVFLRLADSFKSYFNAQQNASVGDCNRSLALTYCVLVCYLLVPFLNICAVLPAFIVLIIMLVKFNELKNRVTAVSPVM